MRAAIYARKSTEQTGVSDDERSVVRQVDHARAYATGKGWTVLDDQVYVDDGISGAEFAKRPAFLRLMAAAGQRPRPFDVLVMSEESRLGREQIETSYALKQLVSAGVRVFFYLDDRERRLDSPTDKLLLSVVAFADELEREKARQRVTDAMTRKAKAGHVTGGLCFGYDNVKVAATDADGRERKLYTSRVVNAVEAAAVRRIFELCALGEGLKGITKILNAEGVPAPRSQRGRPRAWAPSSVREILYRDVYRGEVVWNKTRKRDAWGRVTKADRPVGEWLRIPAEDLRLVSDALWQAAHRQLTTRRENYRRWTRGEGGAPDGRGVRTKYFLSGFARCGCCGASMQAVSRGSTRARTFRYLCGFYWNRGTTVCANGRQADMATADTAVRELLAQEVLRPAIVEAALTRAVALLQDGDRLEARQHQRDALQRALASVHAALANLTDTAAKGGGVPAVLAALDAKDAERRRLEADLAALDPLPAPTPMDLVLVRSALRARLADWQDLLRANVSEARRVLEAVLADRITFRPVERGGTRAFELTLPLAWGRVLDALIPDGLRLQDRVASPAGVEPAFQP